MQQYKLSELVERFGGYLVGEDRYICGISSTDIATNEQITFLTDDKYKVHLQECRAGAIILAEKNMSLTSISKIITDNPYLYFSQVSTLFYPAKTLEIGVRKTAVIDPSTTIGSDAAILDNVVIGKNCCIGNNCQIYPNVVIGDNVVIGNNVKIYPNVTIYAKVKIGDSCTFHSGCVIGSDGFGYAKDNRKEYHKIPQVGGVIIGNKVEIGANTTIDCGAIEPTIIADGVIIDNLVQVGHNVKIGKHSAIAANVGIAGSTTIGNYCTLAGGAGINGHIDICDHAVVGGSSNILKSITKPDLYFGIYPAMPYKEWATSAVNLKNLSKLQQKVKDLEMIIKNLQERSTNDR